MEKPAITPAINLEKKSSTSKSNLEKKSHIVLKDGDDKLVLEPVKEVNEAAEEFGDRPIEWTEHEDVLPRLYSVKDIKENPMIIEALNNTIYELGVINLCWPEIKEPVFETRTCFPESYYTNNTKERLMLAYAESFRRQYFFHFHKDPCFRRPLLLQAPNECGLQKMVCTTIRPTKLCFNGTNTWQGVASLVADYFTYEPLEKAMQHPERLMSPYTAIVRRAGNPFEIAHVLISWLLGANYDAYIVVGCANRDTCLNIRYRTDCPDIPDESPKEEVNEEPEEEPRYKLVPLPDFTSKYDTAMIEKAARLAQEEIDKQEQKRQAAIAEMELPPEDPIDGYRTHAWILVMPGPMGIEEPFFIEPSEGNAYPLDAEQYQQIDSIYNHENYYVNLQTLKPLEEEEEEEEDYAHTDMYEDIAQMDEAAIAKKKEFLKQREKEEREQRKAKKAKEAAEKDAARAEQEGIKAHEAREAEKAEKDAKKKKKDKEAKLPSDIAMLMKDAKETDETGKKKKKKKKEEEVKVEEEQIGEPEEEPVVWENLSHLSYDFSDLTCWEHLLAGEPESRRVLVGVDIRNKKSATDTEKHMDVPTSWVEKLDITTQDFEQRYPGFYKMIRYKKAIVEKFARYSDSTGIMKRVIVYDDYADTNRLLTFEYYANRDDLMYEVRIDHVKNEVRELFYTGRPDHMLKHVYSLDAPPQSIEGERTMEFKWYARLDQLEKIVCTTLTFNEYYKERDDRLESREVVYSEGTKAEPKRQLLRVTETFSRNPEANAMNDIWKRIFKIQDNSIELLYHYAYNFVTNDIRSYIKPNLAETGGKILFYPDKTAGYVSCPCGKPRRPLDVYYGLCDNMEWENNTTKHIREAESDTNNYLVQRFKELTEPTLFIALFNTERNRDAQRLYFEMEQQKREVEEREKEADIDPLQPYLARMFGASRGLKQPLTVKEATILREQCINDFKARQLARQCLGQERFDMMNTEYKNKRLWYLANQFILTPEKETAYFQMSAELAFQVHTLEVRLTRYMDLSIPRFKAIENYLNKHPLLAEYNRLKRTLQAKRRDN